MTQTTEPTTQSSFPLPDVFSSALIEIFKRVEPGIVQVTTEGRGGGTGVIWQPNGLIITNHHVVGSERTKVQVALTDGRKLDAKVLHRNPHLDLALLQVEEKDLIALPIGRSSQLRIGEWVFAIGHPWGQRWVLTAGIMSTMRTIQIDKDIKTRYIQSDVGLAPGNSGGPLLNADGEIVGINAMIFGGDLAVSIPSDAVTDWLNSLPKRRVTLNLEVQQVEVPASIKGSLTPTRGTGLLVAGIRPARQQRYKDVLLGDLLLDVEGQPIPDTKTLLQILSQQSEGATLPARILRDGQVIETRIATQSAEAAA